MCFGGVIGVNITINHKIGDAISILFAEEVGWVLEVSDENLEYVLNEFKTANVPCYNIGFTCGFGMNSPVSLLMVSKASQREKFSLNSFHFSELIAIFHNLFL